MKKSKRIIALLLALIMMFTMSVTLLVSCNDDDDNPDDDDDQTNDSSGGDEEGTQQGYTVSVKTVGGQVLSGVTVLTYEDSTCKKLVAYGETDSNGRVTLDMERKDGYAIQLKRVPDGYKVDPYYTFTGGSANIVLTSSVILPESEGDYYVPTSYKIGDIIHDFEVETSDGNVFRLSEALKTKKAVLINFWYSTCSPCISEFPYIDTVAAEYADDIAVICLNTYDPDDKAAVSTFKSSYDLSLDMAKADYELFAAFGAEAERLFGQTGYPTNIMIDRYGAICLLEVGGLPSEKPFRKMFDHFGADDYSQKFFESLDELVPKEVPDVTQPDSDTMAGVLNSGNINITYYPETGSADAEYSWPFLPTTKDGADCVAPSNSFKDSSYAIMHADVVMKAGDVLSFDYFASTEQGADFLYVLVDKEDIYSISGVGDKWQKCYPYVAKADGTYKISFIYNKDASVDADDDTVYLKNFHITTTDKIDVATYIPYPAASRNNDTGIYNYAQNVKYCEQDGYYHVCKSDSDSHDCVGECPILLADLMGINVLSTKDSIYSWAYNGEIVSGSKNYGDDIITYCSYASNGTISGLCSVDKGLKALLDVVISVKGFDKSENEWLKFCKYYDNYCADVLADPIAGLAPHSAFDTFLTVTEGQETSYPYTKLDTVEEYPNLVIYDGRVIMPRGLWYAFTPTESGVYRVTSNASVSVNGWIFGYNEETGEKKELLVYDHVERFTKIPAVAGDAGHQVNNVSMVLYMEKGTTYYIDIALYEVTAAGEFTFKVEYEAESLELFRSASPGGAFTYDLDENGNVGSTIIAGGIDVALDPDSGYYRHVLATDKNGNVTKFGEYVYLDLVRAAGTFDKAIYLDPELFKEGAIRKDLLSLGGFDFTKTETDRNGLLYLKIYTILGLRDYAEDKDDAFAKALAQEIAAWDLEAMKLYFNSKSTMQEIVNFFAANKSAADDVAALEALLKSYADGDDGADAALVSYAEAVLADDAKLKAFYAVGKDKTASGFVKDYTDTKITENYLKDYTFSDTMTKYLENYVDAYLRDMWGEDYDFWYSTYKMDDLKRGITHGKGVDYTDDMMVFVENMITETNNPDGVTEEAYGCIKVDAELAQILQTLMDNNTFRNVKNSWTKLCYYYEYYGPEA